MPFPTKQTKIHYSEYRILIQHAYMLNMTNKSQDHIFGKITFSQKLFSETNQQFPCVQLLLSIFDNKIFSVVFYQQNFLINNLVKKF